MPDIFDEVQEHLRAEQLRRLLFRYGGLLVAAAVLVIACVGGWEAWKYYQERRAEASAEQFFAATRLADGHPGPGRQEAVPLFAAISRSGSVGYRTLARLRQAALLAEAGDLAGASALWLSVSQDSAADRLLRDLADMQWAQHQIDSGDPSAVAARLQPLARPENPFHGLAQEAQALLALRQGRTEAARDTLKQLSQDESAPEGVRRRAGALLTQLATTLPPASAAPKAGGS